MVEIIPAILAKTSAEFLEKLSMVEGVAEHVHLDIADGIFVPNKTIDGDRELIHADTEAIFSVHLMVSRPENHIARWLEAPVDQIIFHVEATKLVKQVVDEIKEGDMLAGIALNPKTSNSEVEPYLEIVDFVHFMSVEPGFQGSVFVESVVEKIKDFRYYFPDMSIRADGGITPETAPRLVEAGATELVVGSYLYKDGDVAGATERITKAIAVRQA